MLGDPMKPPGSYKLSHRTRRSESSLDLLQRDPLAATGTRLRRIVDSLCCEILEGENLRVRQIFAPPRAIYRIELDKPEMSYQRTTLLDEDALEEILEIDEVRSRVAEALSPPFGQGPNRQRRAAESR
jgi:hypothetical protein